MASWLDGIDLGPGPKPRPPVPWLASFAPEGTYAPRPARPGPSMWWPFGPPNVTLPPALPADVPMSTRTALLGETLGAARALYNGITPPLRIAALTGQMMAGVPREYRTDLFPSLDNRAAPTAAENVGSALGNAALLASPFAKGVVTAPHPALPAVARGLAEGGFTVDATGKPFTGSGYLVANPNLTVNPTSADEVASFLARPDVNAALKRGGLIGGWRDPATGATELNVSDHVVDRGAASRLGRIRDQKALGQFEGGRYVGDVPLAPRASATPTFIRRGGAVLPDLNGEEPAIAQLQRGQIPSTARQLPNLPTDMDAAAFARRGGKIVGPALNLAGRTFDLPFPNTHVHVLDAAQQALADQSIAKGYPGRLAPYYAALDASTDADRGFTVQDATGRRYFASDEQAGEIFGPENITRTERLRRSPTALHSFDVINQPLGGGATFLPPVVTDQSPAALLATPRYASLRESLLADEERLLRSPAQFEAAGALLPKLEVVGAGAIAGQAKLGWFQHSAQALADTFGPEAPRFAALLSAMSPQRGVADNLGGALSAWEAWTAAGRPSDPKAIEALLNEVERASPTGKAMGSRVPNAIRALTAEDPAQLALSGPKVFNFHRNLIGDTQRVTLDTWMAQLANLDPAQLQGLDRGPKGAKVAVASPTYLAYSGRIRQTADYLSQVTGRKWSPAEVQETLWSWGKALSETATPGSEGARAADVGATPLRDLVRGGLPSTAAIRGVPDFATLMRRPQFAEPIARMGLPAPREMPYQTPSLPDPDPAALDALAGNIEQARGLRSERGALGFRGKGPVAGEIVPDPTGEIAASQRMMQQYPAPPPPPGGFPPRPGYGVYLRPSARHGWRLQLVEPDLRRAYHFADKWAAEQANYSGPSGEMRVVHFPDMPHGNTALYFAAQHAIGEPIARPVTPVTPLFGERGVAGIVYHGTGRGPAFDVPTISQDIAPHVGTPEQAATMAMYRAVYAGPTSAPAGPRVMRLLSTATNPVKLTTDLGGWQPDVLARRLESIGVFSPNDTHAIERLYNLPAKREAYARIREILMGKGYDSIEYPNMAEGEGTSTIILDPQRHLKPHPFGAPEPQLQGGLDPATAMLGLSAGASGGLLTLDALLKRIRRRK